MYKWGMAYTAACECGAKEQTAENVIASCPIYHHPNGLSDVNKNLGDGNMSGHLADYPALLHVLQRKKNICTINSTLLLLLLLPLFQEYLGVAISLPF